MKFNKRFFIFLLAVFLTLSVASPIFNEDSHCNDMPYDHAQPDDDASDYEEGEELLEGLLLTSHDIKRRYRINVL